MCWLSYARKADVSWRTSGLKCQFIYIPVYEIFIWEVFYWIAPLRYYESLFIKDIFSVTVRCFSHNNVVICFSFKHEYQPRTLISSSIRWGQEYFWFPVQMSFLRYRWQILSHTLEHNSLFNNIREDWRHRLNLEKDLTVENNNDLRSASWLILTLSFIVNQLCVLLESYGQLLF